MTKTKLTTLLAAATVAALSSTALADHDRVPNRGLIKLGEVGTHMADAEDYVPVSPARRYDAIVLQARDGVVPLSGVKVQFADGRIIRPFGHDTLMPGERIRIDVPDRMPIKMLVLDYNERDRRWGERGTARVDVFGQRLSRIDRDDRTDRTDRHDRRDDRFDRTRPYDRRDTSTRYEWRGGIYVRVN